MASTRLCSLRLCLSLQPWVGASCVAGGKGEVKDKGRPCQPQDALVLWRSLYILGFVKTSQWGSAWSSFLGLLSF